MKKNIIGNYVSLFLGTIEMICFSGICFGFPFIEYIMKDEGIFGKEECEGFDEQTSTVLCESALKQYNTVFTVGVMTSTLGSFGFGILQNRTGIFVTRTVSGILTTTGLVLFAFYQTNAYLIFPAMILVSLPAFTYLVTNIGVASIFPAYSAFIMVMVSGLFDASSGVFLIFKLLSDQYTLSQMFVGLAIMSTLLHIRTTTLMPYSEVPGNVENYSIFESSAFGNLFKKASPTIDSEVEKDINEKKPSGPSKSVKSCLLSLLFLQYLLAYNISAVRTKTIQAWIYPWMDWTYSPAPNSTEKVSDLLDVYGYLLFASPLFAAIPGFLIQLCTFLGGSRLKGNIYGLAILVAFVAAGLCICSGQMIYQVNDITDDANTIVFITLFSICKTILYATPGLFCFLFFPAEHWSVLYGFLNIPSAALMWISDPLYALILNGDDIVDADFTGVSIAFVVVCFICLISPLLILYYGKRKVAAEQKNDERTEL